MRERVSISKFLPQDISKKYLDSICCEDFHVFSENISDIISNSNRTNWMIQDNKGNHVFHFYVCKNEDETVYYIHDGWYEYQDFIKKKLPYLPKKGLKEPIYYSLPFTFIIIPYHEERRITILDKNLILAEAMTDFWDSLIPLLSTNLDLVRKWSEKLYANFEYSNKNEKKVLLGCFLDCLVGFISSIVEAYNHFKLRKEQGDNFNDKDIEGLLSFTVDGDVLLKDEKNTNIVEINDYYLSEKKRIDTQYPENKDKNAKNKEKEQHMLKLLRETINKMRWFLRNKEVVDLILGYHKIRNNTEQQVVFIEDIKKIPAEIEEMFKVYVKKYFSNIREVGKDFAFENLVHGENGANGYYDRKGEYKQADVLKVNWTTAGLKEEDLPIFRGKFKGYEFFKSAQFSDVVK